MQVIFDVYIATAFANSDRRQNIALLTGYSNCSLFASAYVYQNEDAALCWTAV